MREKGAISLIAILIIGAIVGVAGGGTYAILGEQRAGTVELGDFIDRAGFTSVTYEQGKPPVQALMVMQRVEFDVGGKTDTVKFTLGGEEILSLRVPRIQGKWDGSFTAKVQSALYEFGVERSLGHKPDGVLSNNAELEKRTFELVEENNETHITPANKEQKFTYFHFIAQSRSSATPNVGRAC